ncbi:sialic acid-binding Ig-like lectin 5 [Brachyhypopomus gauderio]|uniref:sialic acid-binding Ig-like lectin 5 n=1 Tax=Brachyhypopomus gauderio TaxID=698409 RepID=UPI0040431041
MDRVLKLILTASLLSCSCHCSKVKVPKSVTAIQGNCVVVPCRTGPHTHATWYKYQRSGYPTVYSTNTKDIIHQFRRRTSLLGSSAQGNCSLKINNVRQEDHGISVYVWINPGKIYGDYTEIKVSPPSEPGITVESTQVEGRLFSANCTIRHSCPVSPPQLEWSGLSSVSNEVTTTQDSGGLWVSVAHARFSASRRDQGKRLSCRRIPDGNPVTADPLHISYAPRNVNINIRGTMPVVEGGKISLTCSSDSNPPATDYKWFIMERNSTLDHKTRHLLLQDVRRDMKVFCIARNSFGPGESHQLFLNVHFPPTILPDSACWERGGALHCMCWVEAEPNASISWTVDGRNAILPHFNVTNNSTGRMTVSVMTGPAGHAVTCEAVNYLGNDTYQMSGTTVQGIAGMNYLILAAIVFIVLGMVIIAVQKRLKMRKYTGSGSTQTKTRQVNTYNLVNDDNIYANAASGDGFYRNTEDDMSNIYLNE